MKKKRMITIYLNEGEDETQIFVKEHEPMAHHEALGLLEWAKATLIKDVDTQNALSAYAREEA